MEDFLKVLLLWNAAFAVLGSLSLHIHSSSKNSSLSSPYFGNTFLSFILDLVLSCVEAFESASFVHLKIVGEKQVVVLSLYLKITP